MLLCYSQRALSSLVPANEITPIRKAEGADTLSALAPLSNQ